MIFPDRFKGKVALITGGASGIGLGVGVRMGAEGGTVAIADINDQTGPQGSRQVEAAGGKAIFICGDVTKEGDCERMVAEAVQQFGKLDVLVTSAGIGCGKSLEQTSEADWDRVVGLDLKGVYMISRFAIPALRQSGGGAIVHIASIGGLRAVSGAAFAAAKGGVVNLTRSMGVAYARENIRVNCVCPGVIPTPLTQRWLSEPGNFSKQEQRHPVGRLGTVDEVSAAITFLASDEASFITGAILPVDGGFTAAGP